MNAWCKKYIGKPFAEFKSGPDAYDCWGLVTDVYRKDLGLVLPSYAISAACTGEVNAKINERLGTCDWVQVDPPHELDIVLMALDVHRPGITNHVGVYVGSGACMHVTLSTGVIISNLSHHKWNSRITGYYKWQTS